MPMYSVDMDTNPVDIAADLLRKGGVVAIPTETVYGLAANALDVKGVTRVFEIKDRPFFDPLICHFPGLEAIELLIPTLSTQQKRLLSLFSPGPLTLLVPRPAAIPELVTAGSGLVAVRIPAHPLALDLLNQLDFPLAAPSANPFGYISPTRAVHVAEQLGSKVDYILDGGACGVGVESTVVEVNGFEGRVLRHGGITLEQLQNALPELTWTVTSHSSSKPSAPGMLDSHYAPHKHLQIVGHADELPERAIHSATYIGFEHKSSLPYGRQLLLSEDGSLSEAAAALFDVLHQADEDDSEAIVAIEVPDIGLGRAINDRLRRAAFKRA